MEDNEIELIKNKELYNDIKQSRRKILWSLMQLT